MVVASLLGVTLARQQATPPHQDHPQVPVTLVQQGSHTVGSIGAFVDEDTLVCECGTEHVDASLHDELQVWNLTAGRVVGRALANVIRSYHTPVLASQGGVCLLADALNVGPLVFKIDESAPVVRLKSEGIAIPSALDRSGRFASTTDIFGAAVWDTATGNQRAICPSVGSHPQATAFSPDSSTLAIATLRGVVLWKWREDRCEKVTDEGPCTTVEYSDDGKWLCAGRGQPHGERLVPPSIDRPDPPRLLLFELPSRQLAARIPAGSVDSAFRHAAGELLYFDERNRLSARDLGNRTTRVVWESRIDSPGRIAVSPRDRWLLLEHPAGGHLFELSTGQAAAPPRGRQEMIVDFDVTSRNRLVLTTPSHVVLLDSRSLASTLRAHVDTGGDLGIAVDPKGRRVATPGDHSLHVFDLETLSLVTRHSITRPLNRLDNFTFLPGGEIRAALIGLNEVGGLMHPPILVTWDAGGSRTLERVRVPGSVLALDPTGSMAVGGFNVERGALEVARAPGWQAIGRIPWRPSRYSRCMESNMIAFPGQFSPDASMLAVADGDRLQLWNCQTRKTMATTTLPGPVQSVAFSREGSLVAAAGEWGGAVWDRKSSPRLLARPTSGLNGSVERIRFTPDNKTLLMREGDVLTAWDVGSGHYLGVLTLMDEGSHWLFLASDGRYDGSTEVVETVDVRTGGTGRVVSGIDPRLHQPGLLARILAGERPPP